MFKTESSAYVSVISKAVIYSSCPGVSYLPVYFAVKLFSSPPNTSVCFEAVFVPFTSLFVFVTVHT